jgi:hypothetical protein
MTPTPRRPVRVSNGERRRKAVAHAARRRQFIRVGIPVVTVLVVLVVLVVVKVTTGAGKAKSGQRAANADPGLISMVTGVPAAILDTVGAGSATSQLPQPVKAPALRADGKPRILYVGAEYCPFCATQRWPVIVALSRFGTFTGLGTTTSAGAPEVYPNTSTFTFHGATYTSRYVSFTGVETATNQIVGRNYAPLDKLNASDTALMKKYDAPPYFAQSGSIPFIDFGGRYLTLGGTYAAQVLEGKSHLEIATALSDPKSPIGKGVDGAANVLTAVICELTGQQPANVCTAGGVALGAAELTRVR